MCSSSYVKMKNWARSQVKVLSAHVSGSPFAPNEVPALFCSGVGWKAGITFGRLMKFSRYVSHKEKYRPSSAAMDFVGVNRRQNRSSVLRGGIIFPGNHPLKVVVITVRTTTFASRIWNKGYRGSMGASRWFCKIYCDKAVIVGLIIKSMLSQVLHAN